MKKLITNFSDLLLTKDQMKGIKGGDPYCQSGNYGHVNCFINGQNIGSVYSCCVTSVGDNACKQAYGYSAYASGCA